MAPADVTYYVNDSQVEITDKENVKLLVDDVLDTQVLTDYIAGMEDIPAGAYLFPFSTWTWWTPATATPWSPWGRAENDPLLAGAGGCRHGGTFLYCAL